MARIWFASTQRAGGAPSSSRRVWRENTRGDFWVLDVASGSPAYYDASAINFATGLKGDLLLVHGVGRRQRALSGDGGVDQCFSRGRKTILDDGVSKPRTRNLRRKGNDDTSL